MHASLENYEYISGLSRPVVYVGALLPHVMPPREEITLCYCISSKSCRPYPPRGFDTLRHGKAP